MTESEVHLEKCRQLIEQKLDWGSSNDWQNQDFESLSERIFDQTKVSLSASTLKRIWGKVKYESLPNQTTLNTLAAFAGYTNWREFKRSNFEDVASRYENHTERNLPSKQKTSRFILGSTAMVVFTVGSFLLFNELDDKRRYSGSDFSFSSQPLSKGIPNSVVFDYDASAAGDDSIFIQQSWDPKRRTWVSKDKHQFTSIYYYPGFFKAKLVIGDEIVKEHDLFIPSNDWIVTATQEPVPVYFPVSEVTQNGVMYLPVNTMENRNIQLQPKPPLVRYDNVRDFEGLKNDNFILETEFKSDYNVGSGVCQNAQVLILCENDAIIIPFSIPGCVANLFLFIAGEGIDGSQANLSALGRNMDEWIRLKIEARDKHVKIWINDEETFSGKFPHQPNRIVGISYRFEGTGSVNFVKFSRLNGKIVFSDDFKIQIQN
jgi:hypothetical protein